MKHNIMKVGVLVFPGVEELDFIGPWEMLTMWRTYASGPQEIKTVAKTNAPITCAKGLKIIPDLDFGSSGDFDVLFVPGGYAVFDLLKDADTLQFVSSQAKQASYILSVCSGAFILHAVGLLENNAATTHWKALPQLKKLGVEVCEERFVESGNVWTSAGVSAGTDMTLAWIARVAGEDAASTVQLNAEYYPDGRLYGDQHQSDQVANYIKKVVE